MISPEQSYEDSKQASRVLVTSPHQLFIASFVEIEMKGGLRHSVLLCGRRFSRDRSHYEFKICGYGWVSMSELIAEGRLFLIQTGFVNELDLKYQDAIEGLRLAMKRRHDNGGFSS